MKLTSTFKNKNIFFSKAYFKFIIIAIFVIGVQKSHAQIETLNSGSFIINMGITPQTIANGLKPYGMIYDLIKNYGVPIKWIIEPTKVKDGIDFSYNGIDFRGGPFIVPAEYRTTAVNTRITYWQGQGVVGTTTTSPIDVPVFKTLTVSAAPNWTLDLTNGSIVAGFFANAGIPSSAYGGSSSAWKTPAQLNDCDDVFALPHADPTWATHGHLWDWVQNSKGSLWTGCHSGSATELMFNPANPSQQTNFLSLKTGNATGTGPYALPNNTLIAWGSHSNGTPPYSYRNTADPVMQFMGPIDAAVLNGSEQIYIPVQSASAGWRPTTVIGVYDPDHPQSTLSDSKYDGAIIAYGSAFGNPNYGYVMYEASHAVNKSTLPDNIAAQRAFFNFSFLAGKQKAPDPKLSVNLSEVYSGASNTLSFTLTARPITDFVSILWESSCGGTFTPNNTQSVTFVAPAVSSPTPCTITITLTDQCGKIYKNTSSLEIRCDYNISTTIKPSCGGTASGQILMNITNAGGPFLYSWTRSEGGTGGGTGTTISGLLPGNYAVTVVSSGGSGCPKSFNVAVGSSPAISSTATPTNVSCNGGSNGSVALSVSGGTAPFNYAWTRTGGGFTANTKDLSGITAGTYNVLVTDVNGCTTSASATVTEPAAITLTPANTNVLCYGNNTGAISLTVSGGTSPYTYQWADGPTTLNRTGLPAGTYSITVTDATGCTKTQSYIITQPASALDLSKSQTNVTCYGATNGAINLTVSGGTGPYTIDWADVAGTSNDEDRTALAAGNYSVTVTDANGCTQTLQVSITQPTPLTLNTVVTQPTCPPDAAQNNSDGAVDLSVSGGTSPYTYAWVASGGGVIPVGQAAIQDLTTLKAGTYQVTVTDQRGCTASATLTLNYQNPKPVAPASITK